MLRVLLGALALLALNMAVRAAFAQEASFGPGKIWCATQTTCHLRISQIEDYGFNALTLSPLVQQALLGPCQSREDCTATLVGTALPPPIRLLGNVRKVDWIKAPPEFFGRPNASPASRSTHPTGR